jgi:hypothetical protein
MEENRNTERGVMKKILVSLAAAAVLVAGIATAAVITGSSASAQEADETVPTVEKPERGSALQDVLDGLVTEGEIGLTQVQVDAIMNAMQEKWEELEANRPEGFRRGGPGHGRGFRGGGGPGGHLGGLLEDGVIDAEELAGLPDGHILNDLEGPFNEVVEGGITEQEFKDVLEELRADGEGRFGGGRPGPRFGGQEQGVEGANV